MFKYILTLYIISFIIIFINISIFLSKLFRVSRVVFNFLSNLLIYIFYRVLKNQDKENQKKYKLIKMFKEQQGLDLKMVLI